MRQPKYRSLTLPGGHHSDPVAAKSVGLRGPVAYSLHYYGHVSHIMTRSYGQRWIEGGEITDIRRRAALDASTVSKLAFRAYASAGSTGFLTRCLDVIDRLLAARVRDVEHLVKEFEVERA